MIIDQINWSVDKFILGWVSGTGAVAVYGVGSQINALFLNFSTAISSVFAPRVNRIAAENRRDMCKEFTKLMIKVGRIQYLILMLVASGFVIFGKYFIINIYSTYEYAEAYPVALLLILPAMIPLIQNIGIEIQRSVNKHKVRSIIYFVMALFNIVISIPLAKLFGSVGSAMGTAIGLLLANGIIINIYYQKGLGLDMAFFWKNIISISKGIIIPSCVGCAIIRYIRFDNVGKYFSCIGIYIVIYVLSMWWFGMNQYEKQLLLQMLEKMKRNKKNDNN